MSDTFQPVRWEVCMHLVVGRIGFRASDGPGCGIGEMFLGTEYNACQININGLASQFVFFHTQVPVLTWSRGASLYLHCIVALLNVVLVCVRFTFKLILFSDRPGHNQTNTTSSLPGPSAGVSPGFNSAFSNTRTQDQPSSYFSTGYPVTGTDFSKTPSSVNDETPMAPPPSYSDATAPRQWWRQHIKCAKTKI